MSVNVFIIPEDFRKDQYVLKPIVEQMMKTIGVRARVEVCKDPLLGGISEALKWERITEIIESRRGMVRIFLLIVDRDCDETRAAKLQKLEAQAAEVLVDTNKQFLSENAWQEIEVWALAGMQDLPAEWAWKDVRAERDPKERYYDDYARRRGALAGPYEGREMLAREAARNYKRISQLCPEVAALEDRIRQALR